MPTPSIQRQGPVQRLCFLLPCWHCVRPHLALQLPSLVPHRHGVLAQARLLRGPIQCHLLASSPVPTAYGQTPSASPPRKAAATTMSLLRHAMCACTLIALSLHQANPLSLPPCAGPRCPHAMRGSRTRPLSFICPSHHHCLPPISHPSHASPLFLLLRRCQAAFHPRV
jgi:hypothetical protein